MAGSVQHSLRGGRSGVIVRPAGADSDCLDGDKSSKYYFR